MQFFGAPQQAETHAKLLVQGLGVIANHVQTAAFRGTFGPEGADDHMPSGLDGVGHLIVLRTVIGGAQPIASALDAEASNDILGTIGGDDTILLICRSEQARERVARRLTQLARRPI